MKNNYAVSYISFFDNMLEIKIVQAEDWKDALLKAFDVEEEWVESNDLLEAKAEAFDQDWMFAVIEIKGENK